MDDASPRFRQDLEASATEAEGVACVDVRDPKSGTSFRFYDFEYQLALQFTGQPLSTVTAWASEAYGVDLTVEGINEFAGRLAELGFLEPRGGAPVAGDLTPAPGSAPADTDSAEAEWMSPEGSKTATFVPDPGLLDSPADLTPVAPTLPLGAEADAEPEPESAPAAAPAPDETTPAPAQGSPAGAAAPTPPPRLFDIPSPTANPPAAADSAPTPPPLPAANLFAPGGVAQKPAPSWATDLDDKLQSDAPTPGPTTLPAAMSAMAKAPADADGKTPPPLARPPANLPGAHAPAGVPERRQPPGPDAVQMTSFAPELAPTASAKSKRGPGPIIAVVILLLVIAGVAYVFINRERARVPKASARVRVFSPKPAAVYRWFSGRGTVTDHEGRTLGFDSAGTLAELLPPGTPFATGDVLGRLRAAQPLEALLSRQRARLAFYEQMRDSMRKANNAPELRQAMIKLADKQRLVDETNGGLAKLVIRASEPGEVVETLVKVGMPVAAHAPSVRVKGRMLHGEFALDAEEIARAGKLGFCRVEVIGLGQHASNAEAPAPGGPAADVGSPDAQAAPRFVDCAVETAGAARDKLRVTLPDNLGLVPGQPLRLARERFDAVFPIPTGAIAGADGHRSIWVASAGAAERREVVVADMGDDALVSDGLRVGDEVILDAPADLRPGAPVLVER